MSNIRAIAPIVYGVLVAIVAVTGGPTAIVAIVGALLLGAMYVLLGATGRTAPEGRRRNRRR